MNKIFVANAGEIRSKSDGDIHWISASRVAIAHGIDLKDCYLINTPAHSRKSWGVTVDLIELYPRSDGDYFYFSKDLIKWLQENYLKLDCKPKVKKAIFDRTLEIKDITNKDE